ncbi:serine hydrolase domain-containing protein [Streptomyces kanamyceticus]|uniref:Class A beta-lactamase-related serine hydrolase n=1 Tax=Streptomyces kanamyceticus TaxID=1967 RepID=A0A5J6GRF7_STRKN|nr:serine hydrolase domain-containing protein [Streptomyces kanamyceticus]QEU95586.1 class A beta-lactamase-related serine hydrolase [Streptomyces kanamyceticus]
MITRRTGLAATAAALLGGAVMTTEARASESRARRSDPAGSALQKNVEAVRDAGVSGVIAEVQSAHGSTRARAGVADLASREPVPQDAYYRIGSDTKTFTATVALQLVGEGRLKLTDTVERWLPGAIRGHGNDGRRITVANLLRQTSGLNDYFAVGADPGEFTPDAYRRNRFRAQRPEEQLAAAVGAPPQWLPDADDPAGERRWGYSNTNYVAAGLVIEAVTGHSWAQEVHERIIEPLGLRHTFTPGTSPYLPMPTATAYTYFPKETRPTDTTVAQGGGADGCVISTTHDHALFLRALFDGRLLRPAQLAAMRRTVPAPDWIAAPGVRYGLGIAWRPVAGIGEGIWFHGGTSLGCVSECGVTGDGARAVTSAAFTVRLGGPESDEQAARTLRMVEAALR